MKHPKETFDQERAEFAVIASELYEIYARNKKKSLAFIVFELWVHSLATHHIGELKSFMELLPLYITLTFPIT